MPTAFVRRFLFSTVLAAALCAASGAVGAQDLGSLKHQSWSTDAGLPQASVHQVLQSQDGYLWLATEGGVVRYDGLTFKVFNHESNPAFTSDDVTSLAEDARGRLWFGTTDGLLQLEGSHVHRFAEPDGLPSASVQSLAASQDGALVVLSGERISQFNGTRFQSPTASFSPVNALETLPDGSIAALTATGVMRLSNGHWEPLVAPQTSSLRGMAQGPDGAIWSWSDREVAAQSGSSAVHWSTGAELPGARVQSVLVDRTGTAWIGTNHGLVTVRASAARPEAVAALGVNSILSIFQDAEGNIWIGTETSGLHALRRRAFREEPLLADEEVSAVVQASDGSMWIGTREDGLQHLSAGTAAPHFLRAPKSTALTSPVILALAPGLHGDVWAGTPDGLSHVASSGEVTRYTSSDGLPNDLIRSLLVAHDGTVWIGTRHGLAHLQGDHIQTVTLASGLEDALIGTIFEAETSAQGRQTHELWISTPAGLFRTRDGVTRSYSRQDGLASNFVTALTTDSHGRLWVATRDAGLLLFDKERFTAIRADALPTEIEGMVADPQGFLWLRVRNGVLRAPAEDLARCATAAVCRPGIVRYGAEDGLPSAELVANGTPNAWRTAEGSVWFATRKGVGIVDAAALHLNPLPPRVVIERVLLDSDELPLDAPAKVVSRNQARYTFEYAGLSFTVPGKVLYRTRLEGFDPEWSPPSSRRSTTYTSLPPGRYTFRVQASNEDGVWNETGAAFHIRVLPPFYRRWWFLLLLVLVLAMLAIGAYQLRIRRLRLAYEAVLAERNRIAREIHDTLAQDMVGTTLQLDLIAQMLNRNLVAEAATQVAATRAFVKDGLQHARQSIWNLRANTAQNALPARINAVIARFPAEDPRIELKLGGVYRELPAEVEENVLRILQEALSNTQRHARASTVQVEVAYERDTLVMTIADDGRGFSPDAIPSQSGHYGVQGMRERAAALRSTLDVTSQSGHGTVVKLVVPLSHTKGAP